MLTTLCWLCLWFSSSLNPPKSWRLWFFLSYTLPPKVRKQKEKTNSYIAVLILRENLQNHKLGRKHIYLAVNSSSWHPILMSPLKRSLDWVAGAVISIHLYHLQLLDSLPELPGTLSVVSPGQWSVAILSALLSLGEIDSHHSAGPATTGGDRRLYCSTGYHSNIQCNHYITASMKQSDQSLWQLYMLQCRQ